MKKIILFVIGMAVVSLGCMQSAAVAVSSTDFETEKRIGTDAPTAAVVAASVAPTVGTVYQVHGNWNVRGGASEAGPSLRTLADGDMVVVLEAKDGWLRIGEGEWVNARAVAP